MHICDPITTTVLDLLLVITLFNYVNDVSFKLGNLSDDILFGIKVDQMRNLLIDTHNYISPVVAASSSLL